MLNNLSVDFFLASSTTNGFYSIFDQLYEPKKDWFCYIIKGGPGTGKSSLMKKVANEASKRNLFSERIHCSSDPDSLDAVIIPELKVSVVDGTSPHVMDPIYPGCSDVILNLGEYWNIKKLQKNKDEILNLYSENSKLHLTAKELLRKSKEIINSKNKVVFEHLDTEKLQYFCENLSRNILKKVNDKNLCKKRKLRFVSAITPKGYILFDKTIKTLADKFYLIDDSYDIVTTYILKYIEAKATANNTQVISCISPIMPENSLDAVIIPELKTAFVRKNNIITSELFNNSTEGCKKINASRFLNLKALNLSKNILNLYGKLSDSLISSAVDNLNSALKIHDEIENYYKASMNYRKIDKLTEKIINEIFI